MSETCPQCVRQAATLESVNLAELVAELERRVAQLEWDKQQAKDREGHVRMNERVARWDTKIGGTC